jgi:hypothetical protein
LPSGLRWLGFRLSSEKTLWGLTARPSSKMDVSRNAPEPGRRINLFQRYFDGHGAIIVQLNVEDARNGVAEYGMDTFGDKVIIELKWGQGAKCIGGEIQVNDLDCAQFLARRGYLVDPDPMLPEVQEVFRAGAIKSLARLIHRHQQSGNRARHAPKEVLFLHKP